MKVTYLLFFISAIICNNFLGIKNRQDLELLEEVSNTDYQQSTVSQSVRDNVYKVYSSFLGKTIIDATHNFVVPGLAQDYVPQGIGETKDWIIVASYYKKYGSSTSKNSMLFVIAKDTGKVIKALTMDTNAHVGGVAASSTDVLVCIGSQVGLIPISDITSAGAEGSVKFSKKFDTKTTCSFASFYDDRFYAGQFDESSTMTAYGYVVSSDSLVAKAKYTIPKKIQGFTVVNSTMIAASQSYGRNANATLYLYTVDNAFTDNDLTKKSVKSYTVPPMSEGIFTGADKNLYVMFESGANYYYAGPKEDGKDYAKHPMDKVAAIKISDL